MHTGMHYSHSSSQRSYNTHLLDIYRQTPNKDSPSCTAVCGIETQCFMPKDSQKRFPVILEYLPSKGLYYKRG